MVTPTTTKPDNLRSRLPDPSQFFPELAGIAGAMFKATRNGSIPQTTISLVQLVALIAKPIPGREPHYRN